MSELGPLDAGFLELEDTDQHVSARIGAVSILAGTPGERAEFALKLTRRIDALPRLRQKIQRGRWDVTAPVWVPDPAFDIGHHLTWAALPRPRDEAALWEYTANTMGRRLNRDRPLWHLTIVEELAGERWATILSAHHSMVDGISGISLLQSMCDQPTADAESVLAEHDADAPSPESADDASADWQRLLRAGLELPLRAPGLIAHAPGTAIRTARGMVPLLRNVLDPRRSSSLNGPIGRERRYTVARVPLDEIDRVRKALGGTVNDVALTAVTAALRAVLLGRGEQPGPDSARVLTPVSTRSARASGRMDNRVSLMLPALPVHLEDPLDQFDAVREQMNSLKGGGESGAGKALIDMAGLVPFAPLAWAVKTALRFPQQGVVAVATNVPGPTRTQHLFGADVLEVFPVVPIAVRLRIGIAMLSYNGTLRFGITGDYDSAPDIDVVARTIPAAVHRLLECAQS
ncbi:wax ester/triacylglycerol synthase family O-acyltransferase [Nocardia higoensis]|uniref:wax ester/triacylglycerol synthase family O-acyltransferase n=1 Tax=Nocardia higoensis TaxID=228599 RepID=UPI0002E74F2E|nr:wax ester/triacylglycerol synthase family O-acyltransferase [Nocardia higoensis]